jgi:ABC-type phosphate transport system substrate-binding protein
MSRLRSSRRRRCLHITKSLLGLILAIGLLSGPGAGTAFGLGEQCSGENITGQGAFLQARAQSIWTLSETYGFNSSSHTLACNGSQGSGGKPKVSFTPFGSGFVLHGWGADDGIFHSKGAKFIATDEPPAGPVGEVGTQLNYMKKAIGSDVVVAPIAQTAIAIAANPPALPAHPGCSVEYVTAADLEKVFAGRLTNWRQLSTASDPKAGGDCDQAITRVVREETSGVTYQFKHYLHQVNPEPLECTGASKKTWAQLQSSREPAQANLVWPRKADCQKGEGPVTVAATVGEGSVGPLSFVKANPGTITYGDLPTAEEAAPKQIVPVHNGLEPVAPAAGENEANCSAAKYTLPSEWAAGVNVDWSQVYGSDPKVAEKAAYPICTLSWAIAAADSGGVFGTKAGTTVRDFLLYAHHIEGGQNGIRHAWYGQLPKEVANASAVALSEIGGEGGEEEKEEGGGSGTVLCKAAPESSGGTLLCPSGQGYTGIQVSGSLVPKSTATFKSTAGLEGTFSCGQGLFYGKFNEDGTSSAGGLQNMMFNCAGTVPGWPEAFVSFENPPFDGSRFVYLAALAPQGAFVVAKSGGGQVLLRIKGSTACVYLPTFLSGQVVNGSPEGPEAPTRLIVQGEWQLAEGSEEECPLALQESAQLTVTSGGEGEGPALYVAGE